MDSEKVEELIQRLRELRGEVEALEADEGDDDGQAFLSRAMADLEEALCNLESVLQ